MGTRMGGVVIYGVTWTEQQIFDQELERQMRRHESLAMVGDTRHAGDSSFRRFIGRIRRLAFDSKGPELAGVSEQPAGC